MRIQSQKGFSLIEILIAVGILASAVVVIVGGVTKALSIQVSDEERLQAVTLANNKMVELTHQIDTDLQMGKFPDDEEKNDVFAEPFQSYEWRYTIKKVEIPLASSSGENAMIQGTMKNIVTELSKAVREIKLTVSWNSKSDDLKKEVVLTTHVVNLKQ